MLLVSFLIDSRLLIVNFLETQKLYEGFCLCMDLAPLTPTLCKGQQCLFKCISSKHCDLDLPNHSSESIGINIIQLLRKWSYNYWKITFLTFKYLISLLNLILLTIFSLLRKNKKTIFSCLCSTTLTFSSLLKF